MSNNQGQFNLRNVVIAVAVASIGYGIYVQIPDSPTQSHNFEVTTFVEKIVGEGNAIYVWVILGIVGLLLLKSLFSDKKKEKVHKVDKVALVIVLIPVSIVVIFGLIIVAGIVDGIWEGKAQQQINNLDALLRGKPLPTVDYNGNECDLAEKLDLLGNKLSRQWVEITLCKDDEPFGFYVPSGTQPEIEYRDDDDRVLNSLPISSFVEMEYSWGKPGGMPNLYKFGIPRQNGFDNAAMDSVTFLVRAAGGTSSTPQPQSNSTSSTQERTEATNVTDCSGNYKLLRNCVVVTFGENEKYTRTAPDGGCIMADYEKGAERTTQRIRLSDNRHQYNPYSPRVTMWFYEIDTGQTVFGVECV